LNDYFERNTVTSGEERTRGFYVILRAHFIALYKILLYIFSLHLIW